MPVPTRRDVQCNRTRSPGEHKDFPAISGVLSVDVGEHSAVFLKLQLRRI